jgi:hypothetical protein
MWAVLPKFEKYRLPDHLGIGSEMGTSPVGPLRPGPLDQNLCVHGHSLTFDPEAGDSMYLSNVRNTIHVHMMERQDEDQERGMFVMRAAVQHTEHFM